MLTHADRHLPYTQRPHTRCLPHTRSLTHSPYLTHTPYHSHTRGHSPAVSLSHPVPHSHTAVRTRVPFPARTWFHSPTVLRTRVPFSACASALPLAVPLPHTACWEARTPTHSRPHHSHTVSLSHTGSHSHSGFLAHNAFHPRYACVAARISPRSCTHTSTPHTPGHSHWGQSHRGTRATTRGSGVSIPPKLGVHPFAAPVPSSSQGTTEPTWS